MQLDEWEANSRTKYALRYWCKAGLRAVDIYQGKKNARYDGRCDLNESWKVCNLFDKTAVYL